MDSRKRAIKGRSPKSLKKKKNTSKVGEGLEQRKKLRKDVRPQKVMCWSTKPLGVAVPKIVIKHVPTKPQRHQSSKHEQENRHKS